MIVGGSGGDGVWVDYIEALDGALGALLRHQPVPLLLAAPDYMQALFGGRCQVPTLASRGILGDAFGLPQAELLELALPIAQQTFSRRVEDALRCWSEAGEQGQARERLEDIGPYAARGRVRLLMLENERHIWGRLDRHSGQVTVVQDDGPDPSVEDADLLDELSELVLQAGGQVLVVPSRQMPTETGVAAVVEGEDHNASAS